MNKEIYLVQGVDMESYQDFSDRIFAVVAKANSTFNPDAIKFTITEKAPPASSIIPFSKREVSGHLGLQPACGYL
ncbi:MAG: hypothetical protein IPG01_15475 [Chitinophagaceae bacterium]|nr:hypothetical protein [Chitinophagaceae bacterium]